MSTNDGILFEAFLGQHNSAAWAAVIEKLRPRIHEVDRSATQIWFSFFPLDLALALRDAENPEKLAEDLYLAGAWKLKDQIDSSHKFFYGHRFWTEVKQALIKLALSGGPATLELADQIQDLARSVATNLRVDESLVAGITAVAFMTLQQVGFAEFSAAPGIVNISSRLKKKSPEKILAERARDDSQGLFGFTRGDARVYSVTFDESDPEARFRLISSQELTTAAAEDKRDHTGRDARCMKGEGPIPIECRSAACGTCWVGILGGAEKMSEVGSLEYRRIREFGYIETEDERPLIRLACRAQAFGAVSIVIPPWNGQFGKFLKMREDSADSISAQSHGSNRG